MKERKIYEISQIRPVSLLLNQQWNSSVLPEHRRGNSGIEFLRFVKETLWSRALMFWKFNCCWSLWIGLHFELPLTQSLWNFLFNIYLGGTKQTFSTCCCSTFLGPGVSIHMETTASSVKNTDGPIDFKPVQPPDPISIQMSSLVAL